MSNEEKKLYYRITIIYDGAQFSRPQVAASMFALGMTEDDAKELARQQMNAILESRGFPTNCFKIEAIRVSDEEVKFHLENRHNKDYKRALVS